MYLVCSARADYWYKRMLKEFCGKDECYRRHETQRATVKVGGGSDDGDMVPHSQKR